MVEQGAGRPSGGGARRSRMGRLAEGSVAVAAVVAVVASAGASRARPGPPAPPAAVSGVLSPTLVPSTGALLGVWAGPRDGRTYAAELEHVESTLDRRLDLARFYLLWDDKISTRFLRNLAGDRILVLGLVAHRRDGGVVRWREIAAGERDHELAAAADTLASYGRRLLLIFHHEPEDDLERFGTPAEYAVAFRRVVSVFRERGATNVVWVWNLMAWSFDARAKLQAADFYPGDDVVDWIAADGYNWYGSTYAPGRAWRSFAQVFGAFRTWGAARGKPLLIAEWGTLEDAADPLRKARWFADAAETVKAWPEIKGLTYFNAHGWYFDSSPQALAAHRAMAHDPYFNPLVRPRDTPAEAARERVVPAPPQL